MLLGKLKGMAFILQLVNKKKLQRAEAKALEKSAKKGILDPSATEKKKRPLDLTATASQASNRREAKVDAGGLSSLDVHLESVDVSIGTKYVDYFPFFQNFHWDRISNLQAGPC